MLLQEESRDKKEREGRRTDKGRERIEGHGGKVLDDESGGRWRTGRRGCEGLRVRGSV